MLGKALLLALRWTVAVVCAYLIERIVLDRFFVSAGTGQGFDAAALFSGLWGWVTGPAFIFWFVVVGVAFGLRVAYANMDSGWGVVAVFVLAGMAAGISYRLFYGTPKPGGEVYDPALGLLLGAVLAWLLIFRLIPGWYAARRSSISGVFRDRDRRWILVQREGIADPGPGAEWDSVTHCTRDDHRPMCGAETCRHELSVASSRSLRSRWLLRGEFPGLLKHVHSPGYVAGLASGSTAEPGGVSIHRGGASSKLREALEARWRTFGRRFKDGDLDDDKPVTVNGLTYTRHSITSGGLTIARLPHEPRRVAQS